MGTMSPEKVVVFSLISYKFENVNFCKNNKHFYCLLDKHRSSIPSLRRFTGNTLQISDRSETTLGVLTKEMEISNALRPEGIVDVYYLSQGISCQGNSLMKNRIQKWFPGIWRPGSEWNRVYSQEISEIIRKAGYHTKLWSIRFTIVLITVKIGN